MTGEPSTLARVAAWAHHQFAIEAFHRVLDVMEGNGIDVLPVKGIVLAHTLYEAVEDRPMEDVDLRVRPRDLRRVARAARAAGWDVSRTSRQLGTLELRVFRTLVELETTVGSPGVCAITIDRMLARSEWRASPRGRRHRVPELHDHALHLCVNAFKDKLVLGHRWLREDLLRIARVAGFSPVVMAARAGEARLETLVSIVAEWLVAGACRDGDAQWREVAALLAPARRRRYANAYLQRVERAPRSVVLAVLARAASDSPVRRGSALGLALVGTAAQVLRQMSRRAARPLGARAVGE